MSRVDVREGDVQVYTPVLFGRWTLKVPYGEIDEAVLRRHPWGGKVRLRRSDGDVTLTTIGGNYVRIGNLLRDLGSPASQFGEGGTDVVAHQVELVAAFPVGGMNRQRMSIQYHWPTTKATISTANRTHTHRRHVRHSG